MTESGVRLVFEFTNSCLRAIGGNIRLQVHLFPDTHFAGSAGDLATAGRAHSRSHRDVGEVHIQ
jgi:hypothetical protein